MNQSTSAKTGRVKPAAAVTAEMTSLRLLRRPSDRICPECGSEGHEEDAKFCKGCGTSLSDKR